MKALDISAVRGFVLAAELKSFTRAAEAMDTTQSAVSLRLRRLEEQLGRRLLERTPRQVRLSAEGIAFMGAARELVAAHDRALAAFEDADPRRLVVGISHHLVGGELPSLLRRMRDQDPGLQVEMRVAGTRDVMQAYEQGDLDAALVLGSDKRHKQAKAVFTESFSWFAAAGFAHGADRPLPLATQGAGCGVRNAAVRALDKAGIAWDEVFIGKGAAIVGAAAVAGLAVAVLARRAAPTGTLDAGNALSLPQIPPQEVMLYSALNDRRTRDALRTLRLAFQRAR
jgi:DNA-binding transcriptional LysR family regulator